jgi:hypothetical protein
MVLVIEEDAGGEVQAELIQLERTINVRSRACQQSQ